LLISFALLSSQCLSAQVINEVLTLSADDSTTSNRFGYSVAVSEILIVVGSPSANGTDQNTGAAYLFDFDNESQSAKLFPNQGSTLNLAYSVDVCDNVIAVGMDLYSATKAFLFDATTGAMAAELIMPASPIGEYFGHSIALDKDFVVVGAPESSNGDGAGVVFVYSVSSGEHISTLIPDDGSESNYFGKSVAIDNGLIAVGAPLDNNNVSNSVSVYLFNASNGEQLSKVLPADGRSGDLFGLSIAFDSGILTVGAPFDDDPTLGGDMGSVYLFDVNSNQFIQKVLPDAPDDDTILFGTSVDIQNGGLPNSLLFVGAPWARNSVNGNRTGAAYLYNAATANQLGVLEPSIPFDGSFGRAIAMDNG
jgi:hypothetical protein